MRVVDYAARSLLGTILVVTGVSGLAVLTGLLLKLTLAGSIALYMVVWWTLLFAVLPVRIASQAEMGDVVKGSDPGAPADPALRQRAIWTTVAAAFVFAIVAALFPLAGL